MNEERNPLDLRFMEPDADQEVRDTEGRLEVAFGSLRLLSDKDNPLSLRQAIARARREAETYHQWEASGAPLNDITVRLSDGEELTLAKKIAADLCGLRIVKKFLPGEILHIYKKGDRRFGEVLLYCVEAARITGDDFAYEKMFSNQQTLSLQFRRGPGGEFDVCINYTPPVGELAWGASAGRPGLVAVLGPVVFALAGLWYYLRRRLHGDGGAGRPGPVMASGLAALAVLLYSVTFYQDDRPVGGTSADGGAAHQPMTPGSLAEIITASEVEEASVVKRDDSGSEGLGTPDRAHVIRAAGETRRREPRAMSDTAAQAPGGTTDAAADNAVSCPAFPPKTAIDSNNASGGSSPKPQVQALASQAANDKHNAVAAAPARRARIPIYVKAFVEGNDQLEKEMLGAFIAALNGTRRFKVWTDAPGVTVPKDVYEVNLEFQAEDKCFGTIFARLYNTEGQIWEVAKDCHEYPKRTMLTTTSEEIVAKILPLLAKKQEGSQSGD